MKPEVHAAADLVARTDEARIEANAKLDADRRAEFGQFMTPPPVAAFMASMFEMRDAKLRLLDAGAGVGSLTAAFVAEACQRPHRPESIAATAFELDSAMLRQLPTVLRKCERSALSEGVRFVTRIEPRDFITAAVSQLDSGLFGGGAAPSFNAAILNPPYRKIHSQSNERALLRRVGIETSNLYAAFVALAIKLLEPGGELVAITPRSFCNGPYFRPFRQLLMREMVLLRIHVFDARDRAFREDEVLQENVIVHARKGGRRSKVVLSASSGPDSDVRRRSVHQDDVVKPTDSQSFIHLAVSEHDCKDAQRIAALPCTLDELGLCVSTGRVVDFRVREFLRDNPGPRTVPLIYASHFERGFVSWPRLGGRKPNALADQLETRTSMVANETYVLTKRFTSKEERRRIVAVLYDPSRLPASVKRVGFENHVNYFHAHGAGLPALVARGLAGFLNTSLADRYFRQFNGHTQVNASDLRSLRYPSLGQLEAVGRTLGDTFPDQEGLDGIVAAALAPPPKDSAR